RVAAKIEYFCNAAFAVMVDARALEDLGLSMTFCFSMLSPPNSFSQKVRGVLLVLSTIFGLAMVSLAQPYVPPASHRADVNLDSSWRFIQQNVTNGQAIGLDDSSWSSVN